MFGFLAPIAGIAGSLIKGAMDRHAARRAARDDFEANRSMTMDMYNLQRSNNLDFWNMQNAYNHPKMQMARLKEAGLNPMLVYGHGTVAGNTAGPIGSVSASTPVQSTSSTRYGDIDLGSIFQYSQVKNTDMNTMLQEAQIAKILADIAYKKKATDLLDRVPARTVTSGRGPGIFESLLSMVPFARMDKFGKFIDARTIGFDFGDFKRRVTNYLVPKILAISR